MLRRRMMMAGMGETEMGNWELITDTTLEEDADYVTFNDQNLENYKKFYIEADFEISAASSSYVTVNGNNSTSWIIGMVPYGSNLVRLIRMFIDELPTGVIYGHGMGNAAVNKGALLGGIGSTFFKKNELGITFPITGIRIANSAGNFVSGSRFALYGIK